MDATFGSCLSKLDRCLLCYGDVLMKGYNDKAKDAVLRPRSPEKLIEYCESAHSSLNSRLRAKLEKRNFPKIGQNLIKIMILE